MDTDTIPAEWASFKPEQRAILFALPQSPSLTAAAKQVGIHRDTVYSWAEGDPAFADAVRRAKEEQADNLEAELYRRAMTGQGQMPDTLGIFLLKGYRPMFRDSYTVNHTGKVTIEHSISELSTADRVSLLRLALEEEAPQLGDGEVVDGELVDVEAEDTGG